MPLIFNQPGRIPAGSELSPMVSHYDFFPTLLDYLGIEAPPDPKRVGRSYADFLRGRSPRWRDRLSFEYCYVRAVRTDKLKYVERTREWPSELYDLASDPGETQNRISDPRYRRQLAALRAELAKFFARAGAPRLEAWRETTRPQLSTFGR